jgi:hypothetical protein
MIDILYIWFAILDPDQDAFVTIMASFEILGTADRYLVLFLSRG